MAQPDPPQDVDASPHPVLRRAAVYPDTSRTFSIPSRSPIGIRAAIAMTISADPGAL